MPWAGMHTMELTSPTSGQCSTCGAISGSPERMAPCPGPPASPPPRYKALTITQPFATLIALGVKQYETRDWAALYRGPLLIHAATTFNGVGGKRAFNELCHAAPFTETLSTHGLTPDALPLGAIVATCRLTECHRMTVASVEFVAEHRRLEDAFGNWAVNRYAFRLADVRALSQPIPCPGERKFWNPPADVVEQLPAEVLR